MATADSMTGEYAYRLGQVEKKADVLDASKADKTDVETLIHEVTSIRKTLVGLLISVTTASLGFGFGAIVLAINLHQ